MDVWPREEIKMQTVVSNADARTARLAPCPGSSWPLTTGPVGYLSRGGPATTRPQAEKPSLSRCSDEDVGRTLTLLCLVRHYLVPLTCTSPAPSTPLGMKHVLNKYLSGVSVSTCTCVSILCAGSEGPCLCTSEDSTPEYQLPRARILASFIH